MKGSSTGLAPDVDRVSDGMRVWAALRRAITIDPHSPGQFRAIGPLVNFQPFYDAFDIKAGAPMWRAPELRAIIW